MKSNCQAELERAASRTPQGVRGLKSGRLGYHPLDAASHPARGAWIEIPIISLPQYGHSVAPRKGCVD